MEIARQGKVAKTGDAQPYRAIKKLGNAQPHKCALEKHGEHSCFFIEQLLVVFTIVNQNV